MTQPTAPRDIGHEPGSHSVRDRHIALSPSRPRVQTRLLWSPLQAAAHPASMASASSWVGRPKTTSRKIGAGTRTPAPYGGSPRQAVARQRPAVRRRWRNGRRVRRKASPRSDGDRRTHNPTSPHRRPRPGSPSGPTGGHHEADPGDLRVRAAAAGDGPAVEGAQHPAGLDRPTVDRTQQASTRRQRQHRRVRTKMMDHHLRRSAPLGMRPDQHL